VSADSNPAKETAGSAPSPPSKPELSPARRALEWLWQGRALAELNKKQHAARALELRRRAKVCLELAELAQNPPQRLESGLALAQSCELIRQAIYWGLLAVRAQAEPAKENSVVSAEASPTPDPITVFRDADGAALAALFDDATAASSVADALAGSFADLAELSEARLLSLCENLRVFATSLLGRVDADQLAIERIWLRRLARSSLVALGLVAVVVGALGLRDGIERSRDVARGKAWRASSLYGVGGCPSPQQSCPESPNYFVHTNDEQEPWLEIDLGRVQRVSAADVSNRKDCCAERIVPLVLAVSVDHEHWTEVARSTSEFKRWKTSFSPVDARWVKLYVPHPGLLHLSEVRILR
jgi:hypothetical protein